MTKKKVYMLIKTNELTENIITDNNIKELYGCNNVVTDEFIRGLRYSINDRKIIKFMSDTQEHFTLDRYMGYLKFVEATPTRDFCSLEFYKAKYGEYGEEKFTEVQKNRANTCEKYVELYGEEEGNKKWEMFCNNRKGNKSLEKYIELYGEEEGNKKYLRTKDKMVRKNTLQYYIELYGEEEGNKKYKARNLKNSQTTKNMYDKGILDKNWGSLEYFIKLYGEEEGNKRYRIKLEKRRKNQMEYFNKYKDDYNKSREKTYLQKYEVSHPFKLQYFIRKREKTCLMKYGGPSFF